VLWRSAVHMALTRVLQDREKRGELI